MQKSLSSPSRKNLIREIEIERELLRRRAPDSLYAYTKYMWHVIEPLTEFVDGWHLQVICAHLESVARFEIPVGVFNLPPRHMKSILACVMFPSWVWGKYPGRSFLYASHSTSLATRDSIKTRQLVESEEYQRIFKHDWHLSADENQKTVFTNSQGGTRKAVGVGTAIVGFGADYLVTDDPNDSKEIHSELHRENVTFWYDKVLSTRVNNPKRNAKLTIMQRLHEGDLTGHIIKTYPDAKRLILPAEYDPNAEAHLKSNTEIFMNGKKFKYVDPRKTKGELLWPEHWDAESIASAKVSLGDDGEAQLNQNPIPPKGGLFPKENWKWYSSSPSNIYEIGVFVDAAQKPGISNDYTVIAVWARTVSGYYLLDLWRGKTTAPLLQEMTMTYCTAWHPNSVVIEDKSAGSSLIQYLLAETTLPVLPFNPGQNDKVVRATAATPTVKAGKCFLPDPKYKKILGVEDGKEIDAVDAFVKEHLRFPKVKHDDQVDTTSMMVEYFNKRSVSVNGPRVRSLV